MRRGSFFSLALKDEKVEQCLRSCGSEFQKWGPKQEKVREPRVLRLYCWIFSMRVSEEERRGKLKEQGMITEERTSVKQNLTVELREISGVYSQGLFP